MVVWIEEEAYLTALEVCALLSVKPQTLYAYVSRGVLRSYRQGKRRQRLYLLREVETLVRLRPARRPAARARAGQEDGPAVFRHGVGNALEQGAEDLPVCRTPARLPAEFTRAHLHHHV